MLIRSLMQVRSSPSSAIRLPRAPIQSETLNPSSLARRVAVGVKGYVLIPKRLVTVCGFGYFHGEDPFQG